MKQGVYFGGGLAIRLVFVDAAAINNGMGIGDSLTRHHIGDGDMLALQRLAGLVANAASWRESIEHNRRWGLGKAGKLNRGSNSVQIKTGRAARDQHKTRPLRRNGDGDILM